MKRQIRHVIDKKIDNLSDLDRFCDELVPLLGDRSIVLLRGALGAGKTKTVEFLLRKLGANETSSPTFALHQVYETAKFAVDHFDLYRVESEEDLESSGFWDVFMKPMGWVIVEWAERISIDSLPAHWPVVVIEIELVDSQTSARKYRVKILN